MVDFHNYYQGKIDTFAFISEDIGYSKHKNTSFLIRQSIKLDFLTEF